MLFIIFLVFLPITAAWVRTRLCKLQKGCTRLTAASEKVYQLLVHGRWFSPGTPAYSTTKTGRHDIAENIVESGVKTPKIKIMLHNTCILLE
jgi:hypothetical protein